jgi:hypothetical protein
MSKRPLSYPPFSIAGQRSLDRHGRVHGKSSILPHFNFSTGAGFSVGVSEVVVLLMIGRYGLRKAEANDSDFINDYYLFT